MQARFGLHHREGIACIGQGKMQRMEPGNISVKPFLWLGIRRNLLFPERGSEVPFAIENYPFLNTHGEASISFNAYFFFPERVRRTDAYMIWDEEKGKIKYTLGKRQRLVTDLSMEVDSRGHLLIRSERLDWLFGKMRIPSWPGGYAEVEEWYEEHEDRFHIRVSIAHPFFGKIYAYEGWFRCSFFLGER